MKTIKKNLAILMLALFGLGIIGNNVLYATDEMKEEDEGGGGGGTYCYWVQIAHCPDFTWVMVR